MLAVIKRGIGKLFAKFPDRIVPDSQIAVYETDFQKVAQKVVRKTVEYLLSSQSYNELLLEQVPNKIPNKVPNKKRRSILLWDSVYL